MKPCTLPSPSSLLSTDSDVSARALTLPSPVATGEGGAAVGERVGRGWPHSRRSGTVQAHPSSVRVCALLLSIACLASAFLMGVPSAMADGDSARVAAQKLLVGQQVTLVLEVQTPAGATVELDPAAASWNGVEVIRPGKSTVTTSGGSARHHLEATIAPFRPGAGTFAPAVNIIDNGIVSPRVLPAISWEVTPTLGPDAALELSPIADPASIGGAESPFLRPAIGLAAVLAVLLVSMAAWFIVTRVRRWWVRRPRPVAPAPAPQRPSFESLPELIDRDPVLAYRTMGSTVKAELGRRYGFAASALTTQELRERMEGKGVDRWQARLVGGLLEECDAVVYAGYRPASERRHADLTMAREIVEAVN